MAEQLLFSFLPNDGSAAIAGVVGALQRDVLAERLNAEYSLNFSFETSRFEFARWISAKSPAELDRFVPAHPASMARDLAGAPVFMAASPFDLKYEQDRWPDIDFSDIKQYRSHLID
jgi:peptide chain release factor 3